MQVTANTLLMVNQMLTQRAKHALEMVWFASEKHTHIIIPENDVECLDYEALMALGLITDEPVSSIPEIRKFWLTVLGYEYTRGFISFIPTRERSG